MKLNEIFNQNEWYHGTDAEFTEFKVGVASKRFTTFSQRDIKSQGVFFVDNYDDALEYGSNVKKYRLSLGKQLLPINEVHTSSRSNRSERKGSWDDMEYILAPEVYNGGKTIDTDGGISTIDVDSDGQWVIEATDGGLDWSYMDNPAVVKRIRERGYDSVKVHEPQGINTDFSIFILDVKNIHEIKL